MDNATYQRAIECVAKLVRERRDEIPLEDESVLLAAIFCRSEDTINNDVYALIEQMRIDERAEEAEAAREQAAEDDEFQRMHSASRLSRIAGVRHV